MSENKAANNAIYKFLKNAVGMCDSWQRPGVQWVRSAVCNTAASGVLQNSGKIFLGATCSAQGALDQDAGGQSHSAAGANLPSENECC